MKIDLVMPVHNEEFTIEETLAEWFSYAEDHKIDLRIITSEDGSKDDTKKVLQKISLNANLLVLSEEMRKGYSKAVVDGIKLSDGDITCIVDSDGQCDPGDFLKFWKKRNQNSKFIIIGNRTNRKDGYFRNFISFIFKIFHKILFKHNVTDPSCPYILFQRKHFNLLKKKLVFMKEGFWWGFIAIASQKNFSIKEVKINHRYRIYGKTNVYKVHKIPSIAFRNAFGLIKIKIT